MVSISGPWAAEMSAASLTTSGLVERSGTSADIATACSWCGIMSVTNETSASLKSAGLATTVEVSAVELCAPCSWSP